MLIISVIISTGAPFAGAADLDGGSRCSGRDVKKRGDVSMIRRSFGIVVVGLLVFIFIICILAWIGKPSPRSDNIMDPEYEMTDRDDPTPHPEGEEPARS